MEYKMIEIPRAFDIESIVTVHYFEYTNNFTFGGESHNFWEFHYVSRGEVEIYNGHEWQVLKKGDIIFHKPMEFHAVRANGIVAPNLVAISFDCRSAAMKNFDEKRFCCNSFQSGLITSIVREASKAFRCPLNDPNTHEMIVNTEEFASLQLIKLYLEQLLIDIYRSSSLIADPTIPLPAAVDSKVLAAGASSQQPHSIIPARAMSVGKIRSDQELLNKIKAYFENNIDHQLTIEDICKDNLIGQSKLKRLFHDYFQCGVLEYFNQMRIEQAKQLIRSNSMTFSEIADQLGYSSIHYFSRQFHKQTGMSPSDYLASAMMKGEIE